MDQGLVNVVSIATPIIRDAFWLGRSILRSCPRRCWVEHLASFFPVYTPSYTGAKFSFHLAPIEDNRGKSILTRNLLIWNSMRFLFQVIPFRAMM